MDDKYLDLFFVHLSQQNFESCHQFLDLSSNSSAPTLRYLIAFEVFYISFDWLRYEDSNRQAILDCLQGRIRQGLGESELIRQVVEVVQVRKGLMEVYFGLVKQKKEQQITENLDTLSRSLKEITISELSTYKEACLYEVLCLFAARKASEALMNLDYFAVLLSLTEFREHLKHWELLFIHKKYTPSHKNSKTEYNQAYRWHIQHLHSLLARCALFFYPELHGMVDEDLAEYGLELRERYGLGRVEVMCARLGVEVLCIVKREEKGLNLRYSFPSKRTEEVADLVSEFLFSAKSDRLTEVSLSGRNLLLSPVSQHIFACALLPASLDLSRPRSFLLSLSRRLSSSIPFTS